MVNFIRRARTYEATGDVPLCVAMEAIGSCVPDGILSREGLDSLLVRTQHLPESALEAMFVLESHLGDRRTCCDLSLFVVPKERFGKHVIASGRREGATSAEAALSWYLSEVSCPESFLSRWLKMAILEYDMDDSPLCAPGVFLEAHDRHQDAHPLVHGTRKREKLGNPGVLTAAICAAVGWEEDEAERRFVESLFEALPAGAGCSHAGAFPSRRPRGLRFVFSMSFDDCVAFLADIGWEREKSLDRLQRIADEVGPMVSRVGLSCDITAGGVSRRMGFELFLDRNWGAATAQDWLPFLDYVRRNRLGIPSKVDALSRWPRRQQIVSRDEVVHLLSGINHFKLVLDSESVQVKTYLGARLVSPSV